MTEEELAKKRHQHGWPNNEEPLTHTGAACQCAAKEPHFPKGSLLSSAMPNAWLWFQSERYFGSRHHDVTITRWQGLLATLHIVKRWSLAVWLCKLNMSTQSTELPATCEPKVKKLVHVLNKSLPTSRH